MKSFTYTSASTVDDAIARLGADDHARPLAGGTDLLPLIKTDLITPSALIDIKRASGMHDRIELGEQITLGALVTLADIESHAELRNQVPALVEAAGLAASPQLRNMATIGGNLLQRSRCWYFRSSHFTCWLEGGEECFARDGENQHHAIFGQSPCVSAHPSDPAAALLALDAAVVLRGQSGERVVNLAEFFAEPNDQRRTETTLAPDEILTEIRIPTPAAETRSTYLKAMDRKVWAFALAGVAAVVRIEHGVIADARIVLSGVAPTPYQATAAEQALIGQAPGASLFTQAADAALADARPLGKNGYKVALTHALIVRALEQVTGSVSKS